LLAPARAERLRRLEPLLPLSLEHLELLVLGERPLQLLLGRAQAREDQAQRVAALGVAGERRLLQVVLKLLDQAHSSVTAVTDWRCASADGLWPSTCQWRWKIVWPAPAPTFETTR